MKLNNLIRYNSLKVFSILGYILLISYAYFHFIAYPAALEIDKIATCHFDANFPLCKSHDVEFTSLIVYFSIVFLAFISLIVFIFEFLWKKFKSKNNAVKNYPIFWKIAFWIGIILALIPFAFIIRVFTYY